MLAIVFLNHYEIAPNQHFNFLTVIQFFFFVPTFLAWFSYRQSAAIFFALAASVFSVLTGWVAHYGLFLIFAGNQIIILIILFYFDQRKQADVIANDVEMEKAANERNDLEISYKERGTSISVSFEKYASYYNLRNIANDFSTTLSLVELSQMIVSKTMELIQRGNWCLLFLADMTTGTLSLVAAKSGSEDQKIKAKVGTVLDHWIVRNRQSLIVNDVVKDFRFDLNKASDIEDVRSCIASPLWHESKIIGTLRLTSTEPNSFTTDDLRLLDAVSMLASAAISNAILYQKTEDLAIRDSLTGLYVHRYFIERLHEEHRRSLLTNAPLTLLMADLDHFKECNDKHGHGVGDHVLIKTAELLKEEASHGIVARYGGEEFAILLPKVTLAEGKELADNIRKKIQQMDVTIRREVIPIAVSIGVSSIPENTLDAEELIRLADQKLYQAKKLGRNRVC